MCLRLLQMVLLLPSALPYSHIDTPFYKVVLSSSYEDHLVGVHLANKEEQDAAMQEFVAGRLAAGEMGNGVLLEEMKPAEQKLREQMYQAHGFDEYISEYLVSLNRSLPDRRESWCKDEQNVLVPPKTLPSTSVIIIFHNEAWSTLLRTIYSVLNRSPKHLLEEIILVDDASTLPHLKEQLAGLVEKVPGLQLVRLGKRGGLMAARMAGVMAATGKVLTFLDSHIEATEGWLQPLLERVALDPKAVACPVIEEISDKTLQYKFVTRNLEGSFHWNLEFDWREVERVDWAPYPSSVMAGGLFTIRRDWFEQLGFYDPGMEIWGGEQLELSFKAWMCGGKVETVPCSRVGHIFRSFSPYQWETDKRIPEYNYKRVAAVWMDDWAHLYWDRLGRTGQPVEENVGDFGNVEERKALRASLQCKDFGWYISKVATSLWEPHIVGMGEVWNPHHGFCLDQQDGATNVGLPLLVFDCHGEKGNQYWYYRSDGTLGHDLLCVVERQGLDGETSKAAGESPLVLGPCRGADQWQYEARSGLLRHVSTQKCLAVTREPLLLWLLPCERADTQQKWYFTHYQEEGIPPREASWIEEDIIEDSEEELDNAMLSEEAEEYEHQTLDSMWIEKEEL